MNVSVQAFYSHCSLEVVKCLQGVRFVVAVSRLPVNDQIGQQRCRPLSGAYLRHFASKPAVSLGRLKSFGWPW